jgi:hypothetical protein
MDNTPSSTARDRIDPLVLHARRETLVILAAFVVCMIWSIGCCYWLGYGGADGGSDGGPVAQVLGMPSWVFWGVGVPWVAADLFAVWFCFFFMVDDPLGEVQDETLEGDGDV